jgi:transcriptional regulator with XRE-family HTH domain
MSIEPKSSVGPAGGLKRKRYRRPERLPAAFVESERARAAMAARDVATVFAVLGGTGVSQRQIAALTGQSQSEISEILAGRRVQSFELIERIADGLGTPRGWWGLAYADDAMLPALDDATAEVDNVATVETVRRELRLASASSTWVTPARTPTSTSPAEAAGRHLIGLVTALRLALGVPASRRPARRPGLGPTSTARLRRVAPRRARA